jgi:hypothetical protein
MDLPAMYRTMIRDVLDVMDEMMVSTESALLSTS